MIDVAWSELIFITILALVLIGPKELPAVLRTLGRWVAVGRTWIAEGQRYLEQLSEEDQTKK